MSCGSWIPVRARAQYAQNFAQLVSKMLPPAAVPFLQLCVNLIVCGDGIEHTGMAGMGLSGLVGMGERR